MKKVLMAVVFVAIGMMLGYGGYYAYCEYENYYAYNLDRDPGYMVTDPDTYFVYSGLTHKEYDYVMDMWESGMSFKEIMNSPEISWDVRLQIYR